VNIEKGSEKEVLPDFSCQHRFVTKIQKYKTSHLLEMSTNLNVVQHGKGAIYGVSKSCENEADWRNMKTAECVADMCAVVFDFKRLIEDVYDRQTIEAAYRLVKCKFPKEAEMSLVQYAVKEKVAPPEVVAEHLYKKPTMPGRPVKVPHKLPPKVETSESESEESEESEDSEEEEEDEVTIRMKEKAAKREAEERARNYEKRKEAAKKGAETRKKNKELGLTPTKKAKDVSPEKAMAKLTKTSPANLIRKHSDGHENGVDRVNVNNQERLMLEQVDEELEEEIERASKKAKMSKEREEDLTKHLQKAKADFDKLKPVKYDVVDDDTYSFTGSMLSLDDVVVEEKPAEKQKPAKQGWWQCTGSCGKGGQHEMYGPKCTPMWSLGPK